MSKLFQPEWARPGSKDRPVLKLYNILTRSKEVFVPNKGNHVKWYSCGPTVYDASHMGHARSYISLDILRRVLADYFGYRVLYVMNITDIDDKIIIRARQNYLFEKYSTESRNTEDTITDVITVINFYEGIVASTTDLDKKKMMEAMLSEVTVALYALKEAVMSGNETKIEVAKIILLKSAKDPISDWLDKKLDSTVVDNKIFSTLPRHWENEFHKDMKALNVMPADVLTKVSEYVPRIITFIEKIISNGLAYESNGSVYFNVGEVDKRDNHHYARLVPEAYGDTTSLQEGEGDLSNEMADKRSLNDFAFGRSRRVENHLGFHRGGLADQVGILNAQQWHQMCAVKRWTFTQVEWI